MKGPSGLLDLSPKLILVLVNVLFGTWPHPEDRTQRRNHHLTPQARLLLLDLLIHHIRP